jgi:Ran-binding protein 9/10
MDDYCKFWQNPDGGQETGYGQVIGQSPPPLGTVIGCGFEFPTTDRWRTREPAHSSYGRVFFTCNGELLVPDAFSGIYRLEDDEALFRDVYACIGIVRETEFQVNFGATPFRWKEANFEKVKWSVSGVANRLRNVHNEDDEGSDEELPVYSAGPSWRH